MERIAESLSQLFGPCPEAVLGVENGNIAFMNPAAVRALGEDKTGQPASSALPDYILRAQASDFVSSARILGRRATVSVSGFAGMRLCMLLFSAGGEGPAGSAGTSLGAALRAQLGSMRLATERLEADLEEDASPQTQACLSVLDHSYHQLRRLLLNVFTASAAERNALPFSPAPTDLTELCRTLAESVSDLVGRDGPAVIFEGAPGGLMMADRELVEQIVLNLMSNSLQHTGAHGHVRLSVHYQERNAVISVNDDGEGIPPGILSTVFARWREDLSLTETAGGVGVGLAAARGAAERHGGALMIESRPGHGTQVRVMLPLESGDGPMILRSSGAAYELRDLSPVLTYLAPCLPAEIYGARNND